LGDAASWADAFAALDRPQPDALLVARRLGKYTWANSAQALTDALLLVAPSLRRQLPGQPRLA
jgi:hypothetical protein